MDKQRCVGILYSLEQAAGHFGRGLVEVRVHAGDDDVHLIENGVRKVEGAVGQDVHFDAGKNADASKLVVHGANALNVLDRALVVEAVGEIQVLRMGGAG